MLKKLTKLALSKLGYDVVKTSGRYCADGMSTLHQPRFLSKAQFNEAYRRGVEASQGVDPGFEWRIHIALWAASRALEADGDFVECGVNAGFISSAIMQYVQWGRVNKKFYLIDTFNGPDFTQYSESEVNEGRVRVAQSALASGSYVMDMARVRSNYSQWPRVSLIQGTIPTVFSLLELERIAFVHIDLNSAAPEAAALEYFWPQLSKGGLVLLDDYAYSGCSQQGDMLDKMAHRLKAEILTLPTGQGLLLK